MGFKVSVNVRSAGNRVVVKPSVAKTEDEALDDFAQKVRNQAKLARGKTVLHDKIVTVDGRKKTEKDVPVDPWFEEQKDGSVKIHVKAGRTLLKVFDSGNRRQPDPVDEIIVDDLAEAATAYDDIAKGFEKRDDDLVDAWREWRKTLPVNSKGKKPANDTDADSKKAA